MKSYETLEKLYFKGVDINEEYKRRINSSCAYDTKLKIYPVLRGEKVFKEEYSLFYLPINEINLLQEKIFINSKKIEEISVKLPKIARAFCLKEILINEIEKTNGIEGVHSTKKELYEVMNSDKKKRYKGIINKYKKILSGKIKEIHFPFEIKELYEEMFADDILKDPKNRLDGKLFRKEGVVLENGVSRVHCGDSSEEKIITHLEDLIVFMNKEDIPSLVKGAIVHYYFEYIHPFYDGNGRFGRFLYSVYLARKIDLFTGLSLSYSIFENKKRYSDLFEECSKPRNCGEMTNFVLGMLKFVLNGQNNIIKMLENKFEKMQYVYTYIKEIVEKDKISEFQGDILFIYFQSYIFAKENCLQDAELLEDLPKKSIRTLRKNLDQLEELGFLKRLNSRPLIREISDEMKDIV